MPFYRPKRIQTNKPQPEPMRLRFARHGVFLIIAPFISDLRLNIGDRFVPMIGDNESAGQILLRRTSDPRDGVAVTMERNYRKISLRSCFLRPDFTGTIACKYKDDARGIILTVPPTGLRLLKTDERLEAYLNDNQTETGRTPGWAAAVHKKAKETNL